MAALAPGPAELTTAHDSLKAVPVPLDPTPHPPNLGPDSGFLSDLQAEAQADSRECVVGALILNAAGRVFVQKRSSARQLFPGCWDLVGGHVEPGETLYQALAREIQEETGWALSRILNIVAVFDWETTMGARVIQKREFDFLVDVRGELDRPRLQTDKVTEHRWIGIDDIEILKENRAALDVDIEELVRRARARLGSRRGRLSAPILR